MVSAPDKVVFRDLIFLSQAILLLTKLGISLVAMSDLSVLNQEFVHDTG